MFIVVGGRELVVEAPSVKLAFVCVCVVVTVRIALHGALENVVFWLSFMFVFDFGNSGRCELSWEITSVVHSLLPARRRLHAVLLLGTSC